MERIVIIGGKGTAVVIAEQIWDAQQRYAAKVEVLGFAFDDESFGAEINGFPILCKTYEARNKYRNCEDVKFIFSLYRPDLMQERVKLRESYSIPIAKYYTFIHPSVLVARSARIGNGCVLCANVVVNPNATIGDFNTINTSCLIGHDTAIGNSNYIAGHASVGSNVRIGDGVFVGLNASIRNFLTLGDYAFISMAANVVKNVEPGQCIMGNPGRVRDGLNNPVR